MNTIINEIADWQTSELIAGRNPQTIELTDDQHQRLKDWFESTKTVFITPNGSKRRSIAPLNYDGGAILGMRYTPKR